MCRFVRELAVFCLKNDCVSFCIASADQLSFLLILCLPAQQQMLNREFFI